ncbi:4403_t:CDS:2 [Paraglomus occultum]|uniref:site-specific DNA-methyltransferase (adenine-specific) n=1 Tax=Paraglomus occultum TaxID=144539 RepID=A0A9N9AZY6_9GLOM|nr:4403_t:CDS:2 [Paraglomus occultum]
MSHDINNIEGRHRLGPNLQVHTSHNDDNSTTQTSNWLKLVLNDQEVNPSFSLWNSYPEDQKLHSKPPSYDRQLHSPLVFKTFSPGSGESSRSNANCPNYQSSSSPYTNIHNMSEDQIIRVVEVLGKILDDVKVDIQGTVINTTDIDEIIPQSFLDEFNKLLNDSPISHQDIAKPAVIKSVSQLRHYLRDDASISQTTEIYRCVFNFCCQMTAFLTVAQMFFEIVAKELLCDNADDVFAKRRMEGFMNIFQDDDNVFIHQANNNGNYHVLEGFIWYYQLIHPRGDRCHDLSLRLRSLAIRFATSSSIEAILSMFYTKYFLNVFAKEHQKDHGQFYTPREVMKFMWDRALFGKGTGTEIDKLLGFYPQNCNGHDHDGSSSCGHLPDVPSVLDPCMGVGSFLCEFINRLINAAQQTPSVWNNPRALVHLIQSIAKKIWGIEIDGFAFHLAKLNIAIHIIPLYKRLLWFPTSIPFKLPPLQLFCNDTLNLYLPKAINSWEYKCLSLLRSPQKLKFDYIVTNPPYMIRKTGFISEPDSELFDERILGKGGMQAYAYFFWFCVERCKEEDGEMCLISASQWMGLEFADKLRAWIWQQCHLIEFFQFEPFKVWRKIQTDSLIFRLRRRKVPINPNCSNPIPDSHSSNPVCFLRYMNRKATLQETLKAYSEFNPKNPDNTDMHYKLTDPHPKTILPLKTSSFSFTFLMPTSAVSEWLHSRTSNLPSLCDHSSLKSTWQEQNPLIWHRGPNTTPVYALVVRTAWAHSKFGPAVCQRWLRPVFYWNGKNGGKEAEFWQKMGDELRLEKKENSPAEAYVPFLASKQKALREKAGYSLIMVDREGVDKVREEFGEESEFWKFLREARKHLQTNMNSREIVFCGTSKCGVDIKTKIIHPINYGYFTKNQPRQRFFVDEDSVCVTNQCIYFTVKATTGLSPYFFLGLLNSTTIQHFLAHHCKYDQQGRMRLFRESMAKIPYAPPTDLSTVEWFVECVRKMVRVRRMLFEGLAYCDDADKVGSTIIENLRRGTWLLTGREWEKERSEETDGNRVVLTEEKEGNWVTVKKRRGHGDGVEYSMYPESTGRDEVMVCEIALPRATTITTQRIFRNTCMTKTQSMRHFFESLLYASACLQYAIDQYTYSLYGIEATAQESLEAELKLEVPEGVTESRPRWNGVSGNHTGRLGNVVVRGYLPAWSDQLFREVNQTIKEGQLTLAEKKRAT